RHCPGRPRRLPRSEGREPHRGRDRSRPRAAAPGDARRDEGEPRARGLRPRPPPAALGDAGLGGAVGPDPPHGEGLRLRPLGIALAVAGGALAVRSAVLLAGRGRPRRGARPALVLAGPYLRMRNPLAAGLLLALAGAALTLRSWPLALATA